MTEGSCNLKRLNFPADVILKISRELLELFSAEDRLFEVSSHLLYVVLSSFKVFSVDRARRQEESRLTGEIEALQAAAALDTSEDVQFGMGLQGDEVPAALPQRQGSVTETVGWRAGAIRPHP